jgi:hypothetical protein
VSVLYYNGPQRDGIAWYGHSLSGSGYGPVEVRCEHGNEYSGFIKHREVLEVSSLFIYAHSNIGQN